MGLFCMQHPDLTADHLRDVSGSQGAACTRVDSTACVHGTFVTGILAATSAFVGARHLPRLHVPDPTDLCRIAFGRRRHAERDTAGTGRSDA